MFLNFPFRLNRVSAWPQEKNIKVERQKSRRVKRGAVKDRGLFTALLAFF